MLKGETPPVFSDLLCHFSGSLSVGAALGGVCRVSQCLGGTGKIDQHLPRRAGRARSGGQTRPAGPHGLVLRVLTDARSPLLPGTGRDDLPHPFETGHGQGTGSGQDNVRGGDVCHFPGQAGRAGGRITTSLFSPPGDHASRSGDGPSEGPGH